MTRSIDPAELALLDATAQAELVRSGEVPPGALVDAALAAADAVNPSINAIIHPRADAARAEAVAATGPFAGVPIVVKDLGCAIGGEPHHQGVRALKAIDFRAPHDSAMYRRLHGAGLVTIGRTNTPEWGSTITTEPLAYGPTRNPWNLDHSTGGSSGGSAAAVAAGIVAVGHANDGGGSIRIPASECGLVGLKPSRGRVSLAPDVGESWMGSTIDGVVTRTVRDTAAMLDVLAGYEPGDPYTAPPFARPLVDERRADPGALRIGVLDHPPLGAVGHEECTVAARRTGELLATLGHHVDDGWPAAIGDPSFADHFRTIVATWTANDVAVLADTIGREPGPDDVEADNLALAALGRAVTGPQYVAAMLEVHRWCRRVLSWWHPADGSPGHDLLVTPTIAVPPPRIGYLSEPGKGFRIFELLQYTAQFNVTGQPAISLPLHWTADGLPVGVQLVAASGREDLLVRVAAQLEQASPWAGRVPPTSASRAA
ncbi:MAG: amidase [Acidimicrobiales bacterium]|nr:amidase [Acidimicrobiales bacterium]MCB9395818.1 amidase [Acidimicrobiaceae bacterium]